MVEISFPRDNGRSSMVNESSVRPSLSGPGCEGLFSVRNFDSDALLQGKARLILALESKFSRHEYFLDPSPVVQRIAAEEDYVCVLSRS